MQNKGALFVNNKRDKESSPHFTGKINVDGVEYLICGWNEVSKNGMQYMQLSIPCRADQGRNQGQNRGFNQNQQGFQQQRRNQGFQQPQQSFNQNQGYQQGGFNQGQNRNQGFQNQGFQQQANQGFNQNQGFNEQANQGFQQQDNQGGDDWDEDIPF